MASLFIQGFLSPASSASLSESLVVSRSSGVCVSVKKLPGHIAQWTTHGGRSLVKRDSDGIRRQKTEKEGERGMAWSERPKFKLSGEERG